LSVAADTAPVSQIPPADTRAGTARRRRFLGRHEAALVGITMIWGVTFLVVHDAMAVSGPLFFVGLRFATAALTMTLLSLPALPGLTRRDLVAGGAIGLSIFLGYTLQTYGLRSIPSSESAFITALYVPLVPLLQWLVLRRRPGPMSWVGVGCAFLGLLFLAGPQGAGLGLGIGEGLTVASTLAIAAEIVLIGRFAATANLRRVTMVQLGFAALIAFALMPALHEPLPGFSWRLIASACGLGLASGPIQLTMNWAQKRVSPSRAAVIYAGEPVFAGIVGRIAGERLPPLSLLGAALIVAGVIVGEWRPTPRPSDDSPIPRRARPACAGAAAEAARQSAPTRR